MIQFPSLHCLGDFYHLLRISPTFSRATIFGGFSASLSFSTSLFCHARHLVFLLTSLLHASTSSFTVWRIINDKYGNLFHINEKRRKSFFLLLGFLVRCVLCHIDFSVFPPHVKSHSLPQYNYMTLIFCT